MEFGVARHDNARFFLNNFIKARSGGVKIGSDRIGAASPGTSRQRKVFLTAHNHRKNK
jgi:hypothetical protein